MIQLADYTPHLVYIREQQRHMAQLTYDWSCINSGSYHMEGLARMLEALKDNFMWLEGETEILELAPQQRVGSDGMLYDQPLGKALRIRKRPTAPLQLFLGGHMDTVFGKEHAFQQPRWLFAVTEETQTEDITTFPCGAKFSTQSHTDEPTAINGPGVADLKGGLVVMLKALEALERSPWRDQLGWEILLNPDEEIGSHGSVPLLVEAAKRCQLGLVYEPSLPDGTLVSGRKGSGNFTIIARGKAAHAGREFDNGRNAIAALSEITQQLWALNGQYDGVTLNPGKVEGGGPLNMVPDLAMLHFNVRVPDEAAAHWVEQQLREMITHTAESPSSLRAERSNPEMSPVALDCHVAHAPRNDGCQMTLHGGFTRPAKVITPDIERLQTLIAACGQALDLPIQWQATGGCCDGNNLAAAGLPNIDTLGVRGAHIHSSNEYVLLDSLVERAELSALLLMALAKGDLHA